MRKRGLIGGVSIALALGLRTTSAEVPAKGLFSRTDVEEGRTLVVIGNPFLELGFDPAWGGRCRHFVFRDNGEQLVGESPVSGFFIDHWAKYIWPSGLMWQPYEYAIIGDGENRIGIRLSITVPPMGGGKGGPNDPGPGAGLPTSPELIGLQLRKEIWLHADHDGIEVHVEIANSHPDSRAVAPYIQHNLEMSGSPVHDNWYMPSTRGVEINIQPDVEKRRGHRA